jgi:arginyl-tRNA synthetase
LTETERDLVGALERFHSAISNVGKNLRVSQLTEYGFDLATCFTNFYEHPDPGEKVQTPFIYLQDQGLQDFRLSLVKAFQTAMANLLRLMGMPTLEKI